MKKNGYPVPHLDKIMINVTQDLSDARKEKDSKKKSGTKSLIISWRRY
jgi:hypothetical protein